MRLTFNKWIVSGEVFYLKKLEGEFAASVRIRGTARRVGVCSTDILEFGCLMQKEVYDRAVQKGLKQYCWAVFFGHLESWVKDTPKGQRKKIMFLVDSVNEVN